MRVLYLDCFSGISGDMMVGALCDLGIKPSAFEWELGKLEIGDFHAHWERQARQNIEGVKFSIHEGATHTHEQDEEEGEHGPHHHEHGEHEHGHSEHGHSEHEHGEHEHGEHEHGHSEHAHGEHAHGEHAHGEHAHGEHAHGEHAHGEHAHGEHAHGEHAHGEHAHGEHAHGEHAHGEHAHGEHAHGEHAHGEHAHGEHAHGEHAHGEHAHGEHAHGEHAHGEHEHHHHSHEEEHAHGRNFREIRALIQESGLSDFVKKHAVGIFERIAKAEGKIHGMKAEEAEFHEVGALDSIADIVLACVGIELLRVERIVVSPLAEGHGWIEVAHGRFPVPAPATLEILAGIPLGQMDEPFEFITPTGAAIAAEFAHSFGRMPEMKVEKIGYGVGSRKLKNRPNVLRAIVGEAEMAAGGGYERDQIVRIETNIDDLSPEIVGAVTEQLLKEGALDVFLTPIQMKKNRPGVQLTALCEEGAVSKIAEVIFRQTTAFGLRMDRVDRLKLARAFETVQTPHGLVKVKIGSLNGEMLQIAPEYESCREVSEKSGQPLRAVYEAAVRAKRG